MGILLFISMNSKAQSTIPALERNLTLQLNSVSIEIVLNKIANAVDCQFSYSPQSIGSSRIVSVNVKDKSVREVLNSIFTNKVKYKARGNYIILQKKTQAELEASKSNLVLKGYVTDANTGKKIPNATIYDKKSLGSANSDDYGYYEIKLKNERELQLNVNKQNYNDTIILVKQTPEELINVAIYPSKADSNKVNKVISKVKKSALDFFVTARQKVNSLNVKDTISRRAQISFVPYFGTNGMMSGNVKNDFSINVVAGYSQATQIAEIGGMLNVDRYNVEKLQLAGFANVVGGDVKGVQMAGFTNVNNKGFKGLQAAGFLNVNKDTCRGVQLAGSLNVNRKKINGIQAAGIANINAEMEKGIVIAGLTNLNRGNFKGIELAGFANHHSGNMNGVQAAGFYNYEQNYLHGVQVAGFINYAKKVKGLQLGFINVADSCDGLSIGFFSYVKSGYHRIEISTDEQLNYNLAFRTGTQRFYTIFTAAAGQKTFEGKSKLFTAGYGIGTNFQLAKKLQLNLDLVENQYVNVKSLESQQYLGKVTLSLDYYLAKKISIFAGPVINVALLDQADGDFYTTVYNSIPSVNYVSNLSNKQQVLGWFGAKAGIRFL